MPSDLPLTGVRVVALEQAVAGPFCSRQLADMGADVIKVERPEGDFARDYDGALRGLSAYFAWLNRGKRSVVLNLKQQEDFDACWSLIATADVFVHNLAPAAIERLGFDYSALAEHFPQLIWCSISGYGPDGPDRDRKAYDLLVQAEAGVISLTGTPEQPAKVGVSIADISSGLYAYSSILAALLQRATTGVGQRIDISMLECLTEWATPPLYLWEGQHRIAERSGLRHPMVAPYGAYACRDGSVVIAVQNEREWQRFCAGVLGQPALAADLRFAGNAARVENRVELETLIESVFGGLSRNEAILRLQRADLAYASILDMPALRQHPQLTARERWRAVDSPVGLIPALIPPHNLSQAPPRMGKVPALGEHTEEVLAELAAEPEEEGEE